MKESLHFCRRDFLKDVALGTAALFLWGCSSRQSPFTESERECVVALAEQIVPRDEFPGATDVGVINYIENWISIYYPERAEFYKRGIAALQSHCSAKYSKPFQQLDFDTQESILKDMERGRLDKSHWIEISQTEFFGEILDRSMQGFYGNPRHGGNKDFASYAMMKLDSPLVIGRNQYSIK